MLSLGFTRSWAGLPPLRSPPLPSPASSPRLTRLPVLLPRPPCLPPPQFACTHGCPFDCASAKAVFAKGHELADHTVDHKDLRTLTASQVQQQILGARSAIAACGIPAAAVAGFRSPYLSDSPAVRQALSDAGFRYDSSVGAPGGGARPWPAPIRGGMPYDCSVGGNKCGAAESYPTLWEVPLYSYPGGNTMVRRGGWAHRGACGEGSRRWGAQGWCRWGGRWAARSASTPCPVCRAPPPNRCTCACAPGPARRCTLPARSTNPLPHTVPRAGPLHQ